MVRLGKHIGVATAEESRYSCISPCVISTSGVLDFVHGQHGTTRVVMPESAKQASCPVFPRSSDAEEVMAIRCGDCAMQMLLFQARQCWQQVLAGRVS